jgi:hypothetical protein
MPKKDSAKQKLDSNVRRLLFVVFRRAAEKKNQKRGRKKTKGGKKGKGTGKRTGVKPKGGKGSRKPREKMGRKRR